MSDLDYGPQADAVHAIEERFTTLTKNEKNKLYELRDDAFWEAWSVVGGGRAGRAGLDAARAALFDRLFGWRGDYSAYGAALAVLLRHTIGQDGFTQAHYDALTKPWVTVTGTPAHPDDKESSPAEPHTTKTDELEALATMVDLLRDLDKNARSRIICYLGNRFTVDE